MILKQDEITQEGDLILLTTGNRFKIKALSGKKVSELQECLDDTKSFIIERVERPSKIFRLNHFQMENWRTMICVSTPIGIAAFILSEDEIELCIQRLFPHAVQPNKKEIN